MTNAVLSDQLNLYSKLMDIHGENDFKVKSYANAAFQLDRYPNELSALTLEQIAGIRGIGKSIAQDVSALIQTNELPSLNLLLQNTPAGILELMKIKGIGPKKIRTIWKELQIETPGELLYACNENRLIHYKGFGAKTQKTIQEAVEFFLANQGRYLYATMIPIAQGLKRHLENMFSEIPLELTGAFIRQEDIIDQVEFVIALDPDLIIEALEQEGNFEFQREEAGTLYFLFDGKLHIEITPCDEEQFVSTLFFTTNSSAFNECFQEEFPDVDYTIPVASEEEYFEQANIPYIPPCLRNDSLSVELAKEDNLPELIQPNDVKGVIHNHSTWSDGEETIETMAKECIRLGYEYLVMSDHSVTSFYANGLSVDRIYQQHEEIDRLNEKLFPFKIFKSIECDILSEGQLDYADDVLATFDLVIASIHQNLNMTEEKAMKRILRAIENPFTTILGHPTGRLLLSRKGYPLNFEEVLQHCAKHKVVVEINANPRRLDLDWTFIQLAKKYNVLLSINPDAHSLKGIQDIGYGILAAQKGGLTQQDNLSSLPLTSFEQFLHAQKNKN